MRARRRGAVSQGFNIVLRSRPDILRSLGCMTDGDYRRSYRKMSPLSATVEMLQEGSSIPREKESAEAASKNRTD